MSERENLLIALTLCAVVTLFSGSTPADAKSPQKGGLPAVIDDLNQTQPVQLHVTFGSPVCLPV